MNVEKLTVYIEYTTGEEIRKQLKKILELGDIKVVELHIIFSNTVSKKAVFEILEIEKNLSLLTEIVFSNYATIKFSKRLKSFIRQLYAKDFCVELYLSDNILGLLKRRRFRKILNGKRGAYKLFIDSNNSPEIDYIKYSEIGLPLNFVKPDYSIDLRDWFDRWAVSQNTLPINIFDQILRVILLSDNTHNCSFNSCLGKNIYISAKSVYSFCPKNPNKTTLSISDITSAHTLSDVFYDKNFVSVLEYSLKRRGVCLETCPEFAFCQGGCPLLSQNECINKNYVMLVLHIKKFLEEVLKSNDLSKYNYSIKDAIYTAMAFNSTFGILKNERGEK